MVKSYELSFGYKLAFTLSFFIVCLFFLNDAAYAGGIYIHRDTLLFNGILHAGAFTPNELIEIEFKYDWFSYAGKPNAYIVFEVFKKKPSSSSEPIGYFLSPLRNQFSFGRARFHLPDALSEYEITYHVIPYFSNNQITEKAGIYGGYLETADIKRIKQFYSRPENSKHTESLAVIKTKDKSVPFDSTSDVTLYFENPSQIMADVGNAKPLSFTWVIGPESSKFAKEVEYSYRLDPVEDWTIYANSKKAKYDFLRPGNYTFQVKARYKINNVIKESSIAQLHFTLEKQIFGLSNKAEITSLNDIRELPRDFFKVKHYRNSRALLIGVKDYSDHLSFVKLPFIDMSVKN